MQHQPQGPQWVRYFPFINVGIFQLGLFAGCRLSSSIGSFPLYTMTGVAVTVTVGFLAPEYYLAEPARSCVQQSALMGTLAFLTGLMAEHQSRLSPAQFWLNAAATALVLVGLLPVAVANYQAGQREDHQPG